jgi:hypothetical protein
MNVRGMTGSYIKRHELVSTLRKYFPAVKDLAEIPFEQDGDWNTTDLVALS